MCSPLLLDAGAESDEEETQSTAKECSAIRKAIVQAAVRRGCVCVQLSVEQTCDGRQGGASTQRDTRRIGSGRDAELVDVFGKPKDEGSN